MRRGRGGEGLRTSFSPTSTLTLRPRATTLATSPSFTLWREGLVSLSLPATPLGPRITLQDSMSEAPRPDARTLAREVLRCVWTCEMARV